MTLEELKKRYPGYSDAFWNYVQGSAFWAFISSESTTPSKRESYLTNAWNGWQEEQTPITYPLENYATQPPQYPFPDTQGIPRPPYVQGINYGPTETVDPYIPGQVYLRPSGKYAEFRGYTEYDQPGGGKNAVPNWSAEFVGPQEEDPNALTDREVFEYNKQQDELARQRQSLQDALSQAAYQNTLAQQNREYEMAQYNTAQAQLQNMATQARGAPTDWYRPPAPENIASQWINQWKHSKLPASGTPSLGAGSGNRWFLQNPDGSTEFFGVANSLDDAIAKGLDKWVSPDKANAILGDRNRTSPQGTASVVDGQIRAVPPEERTLFDSGTGKRVEVPEEIWLNLHASGAIRDVAAAGQPTSGLGVDLRNQVMQAQGGPLGNWVSSMNEPRSLAAQEAGIQSGVPQLTPEQSAWLMISGRSAPPGVISGWQTSNNPYEMAASQKINEWLALQTNTPEALWGNYASKGPIAPQWTESVLGENPYVQPPGVPNPRRWITDRSTGERTPYQPPARLNLRNVKEGGLRPVSAQTYANWTPSQQQGFVGLANEAYGIGTEDWLTRAANEWSKPTGGASTARRRTKTYA